MRLVYKFISKDATVNDRLCRLCKISKNLYNQALYTLKESLKNDNKWLSYYELDSIMKSTNNLEGECNYKLLKAQVSQQTIKAVCTNVNSYVNYPLQQFQ